MVSADQYHKFLAWQGMELYPGEQGDTTYTPYQEHNNGNRGGTSPDGPQSPPEHPQHLVSPDPPCLHNTSFTCYTVNASASAVGELNKALKVFPPPAQEKDSTRENEKTGANLSLQFSAVTGKKDPTPALKIFSANGAEGLSPPSSTAPPESLDAVHGQKFEALPSADPPFNLSAPVIMVADLQPTLQVCCNLNAPENNKTKTHTSPYIPIRLAKRVGGTLLPHSPQALQDRVWELENKAKRGESPYCLSKSPSPKRCVETTHPAASSKHPSLKCLPDDCLDLPKTNSVKTLVENDSFHSLWGFAQDITPLHENKNSGQNLLPKTAATGPPPVFACLDLPVGNVHANALNQNPTGPCLA